MQPDLIRHLIDRLLAAAHREGTLTEAVALQIEEQFRHDWRGAEIVVSRRPRARTAEKRPAIVQDYLAGEPVERIAKNHGISRATLYRVLKGGER